MTAELGVEVDLSSLNDASAYRINGSLSSKQLTVEGLALQNVSAIARYADGTLALRELVATVPDPRRGEPSGRFNGDARMRLIPVGALTASLRLDDVPLEQFRRRIEALASLSGGRLSGRLTTEAPVATIRNVNAWRGNGQLVLVDLVAAGRNISRVETALEVESGMLTLSDAAAIVEGERVSGSGSLGLEAPYRFDTAIDITMGELSRLGPLLRQTLPGAWSGGYAASVKAAGALRPFALDATASIAGDDWRVADVPVARFSARARSDGKTVKLTELDARAADGDISGSANLALQAPFTYDSSLIVEGLRLSETGTLARTFDPRLQLDGIASGEFTSSGTLSPQAISAVGELTIRNLLLNGQSFATATFKGALSPNAIELKSLELVAADSRVTGKGRIELTGRRGFSLQFAPERFDLATLEPVITVALRDESAVQQTVAYRGAAQDANGSTTPDGPESAPEIGGTATGSIDATGDLLPFKLDALDGSLSFENLAIGGVTFDRAELVAKSADNTISLSRVLLTKGNGRVEGEGSFGLAAPGAFTMSLHARNFVIGQASPLFGAQGVASATLPPISGALDGNVTVAGETQPFRLTNAVGTLTGNDIAIGRLLVDRFEVTAATADNVININEFAVVVGDGRLTGNASIGLNGQQPFEATLRPQAFRIELLEPLFGEEGLIESDFPPVAGRLTGEMTVKGRLAPQSLEAVSGTLRSENGSVSGIRFQRAALIVASEAGVANISELSALSGFGSLHGSGSLGLSAPYNFSAELEFRDFDLSAIGDLTAAVTEEQRADIESPAEVAPGPGVLPIELEGLANVEGAIEGTVSPFVLTGSGRGGADRLVLNANELSTLFKRTTLASPAFRWRYNERQLTLADIRAGLGGGSLNGTAAVPLGDAVGGRLDLKMTEVALADLFELPAQLNGAASAEIAATISPVGEDGERSSNGTARLEIPALQAGRVAAGDVEASLTFDDDVFDYDVKGTLFDGPIATHGTIATDADDRNRSSGHFEWTAGNLSRLAAVFSDDPSFAGRVDAHIDFDLAAATKATATIEVTDVRHGATLLSDRFDARLLWTDSELRIENVAGAYAGGSVSVAALLNPFDPARSSRSVAATCRCTTGRRLDSRS